MFLGKRLIDINSSLFACSIANDSFATTSKPFSLQTTSYLRPTLSNSDE
jgi:hypothetical protein